jgi:hypothetical protein
MVTEEGEVNERETETVTDVSTGKTSTLVIPTHMMREVREMFYGIDESEQIHHSPAVLRHRARRATVLGRDDCDDEGRARPSTLDRHHAGRETVLGRMSEGGGGDVSEFDQIPIDRVYIDPNDQPWIDASQGGGFDQGTTMVDGDEEPAPFEALTEEHEEEVFPVLKRALRQFEEAEAKPRVVRIDTDHTYDGFACEKAIQEIARRVSELRAAFEQHLEDHQEEMHPGYHGTVKKLREWDEIVGEAMQTISDLRSAGKGLDAVDKMPAVPVDLPVSASGKVKCWRDGDAVVCSMRFAAADGSPRVATMAARPSVDVDDVLGWARGTGVHPVTVLGALTDLADVACGKRLVRDVAGAALRAQRRLDVLGMDGSEPVVLTSGGDAGAAPLAAVMHVEQRANAGDPQAKRELAILRVAAKTPSGQQIAGPLLAESSKRLAEARARKEATTKGPTFAERYAALSVYV